MPYLPTPVAPKARLDISETALRHAREEMVAAQQRCRAVDESCAVAVAGRREAEATAQALRQQAQATREATQAVQVRSIDP